MKEAANAYPEVHKFLQYLAVEKNTSALTVKNYAADIDIFAGFLKTRAHNHCPQNIRPAFFL